MAGYGFHEDGGPHRAPTAPHLTSPRRILEVAGSNLGKEPDHPDSDIHP
jgi:hypothetical protein